MSFSEIFEVMRKKEIRIGIDDSSIPPLYAIASDKAQTRTYLRDDAPIEIKKAVESGVGCAIGLPTGTGIVQRLHPPMLPESKLAKVLPGLLDLKLPFSLDQCKYAFPDLDKNDVYAIAVRNEDLSESIEHFNKQGFNPERIVPTTWAVWRHSFDEFPCGSPEQKRAVLLASGDGNTLVITGTGTVFGGSVIFSPGGRDIESLIRMSFGGIPDNLLCICAGLKAAECEEKLSKIFASTRVSICISDSPIAFIAEALAEDFLRHRDNSGQLRIGEFAHPRVKQAKHIALSLFLTALFATSLLMLVSGIVIRISAATHAEKIAQKLENRIDSIAGYDVRNRGVKGVTEAEDAFTKRQDPFVKDMSSTIISTALSQTLSAASEAGVTLSHIGINSDGLTASGSAKALANVEKFAEDLAKKSIFVRVETSKDGGNAGNVTFMLTPGAGL